MNNKIIFAAGLGLGAAIGSVATYFLTRSHFMNVCDDTIDEYADQCKERIDAIVDYYEGGKDAEETLEEDESAPEPEEFRDNAGVKKYHHYVEASFGSSNVQSVFSKDNVKEVAGAVRFKTEEEKVTEGQKDILRRPELDDVPGVEELDSEEFDLLDDDEYTRVYLKYDANKDELKTNDDEIAEAAYAKSRSELIGNVWRWATDYVSDETDEPGYFFIQNDNLKIGFCVEVSFDPSKPMVGVG